MTRLKRALSTTLFVLGGAVAASGQADPFTFLHADFEQELIITAATTSGEGVAGVTLGLDGFLYTNDSRGSRIQKWDPNNRTAINGDSVATRVSVVSNSAYSGWGITTDSSGDIYALGSRSLSKVDTTTLAPTTVAASGSGVYGLAYEAGRDTFISTDGSKIFRTTKAGVNTTVATSANGFIDQVAIDPTGQFIAGAALNNRQVVLWDATTGAIVNVAAVGRRPDGIAFDANGNVYTNNTNGTITRLEFASGYAAGVTGTTLIASGGFYGDLAGVGADGSFYVSQYGTRFSDGTTSSRNSIVRLSFKGGGGFIDGGTGGSNDPTTGSVPEPSSIALLAVAMLSMVATRRRRWV